jgi:hypothetical protein
VFVIETIIEEVLVLSLFFFVLVGVSNFVLGVSWVQIWQYGSKVYFCQKYYSYNDYKPIHVSHIEAFYGPNFKCES